MLTQRHASTTRSDRSPRWDLLGRYRVTVDGQPFLDRLRLVQTPLFAVLLTRIYQADGDRDPHNHSRAFATLILRGGYTERVWPYPEARARALEGGSSGWAADVLDYGTERHHRRFSLMTLPQTWAHRITQVDGQLVTLVFAGRYRGGFSFWTPDGPVSQEEYG